MTTTTDLSKFGARERAMLVDILKAWEEQGLPHDFNDDEVVPMMNTSGNVFLTNEDFQVAKMNGDKLESFYYTPNNGYEGFLEELLVEIDDCWPRDDVEYLLDCAETDEQKQEIINKAHSNYKDELLEYIEEQ